MSPQAGGPTLEPPPPSTPDPIAAAIASRGWCVELDFLPAPVVAALRYEAEALHRNGAFEEAGIGSGEARAVHQHIRRAELLWLRPPYTAAQRTCLDALEDLRAAVQRATFLGLFEIEAQLALFPPGGFYRRHLDRPRRRDERLLTATLFLDRGWRAEDGGALRVYLRSAAHPDEEPTLDVRPEAGTLVTFLSGDFEHEVLPTARQRFSLTAWFRSRA